ncbi:MAG: hypothetical protein H6R04_1813 [Burkholderiaceae bacterium]|nr:hypothetical protein [Burkholderiaceae bacterium]
MQKISIEMPVVSDCSISDCGYNAGNACHARAITVGHKVHPDCGTYFSLSASAAHSKGKPTPTGVGACSVSNCRHNEDYECVANKISIGQVVDRINCLTYAQRS